MAIYTKKGDRGETSLYNSNSSQIRRISKDSLRIEAIGAIDEANSYLGICISSSKDKILNKNLVRIQKDLLRIGSILSGSKLLFNLNKTKFLEKEIDQLEETLPVLKNFIVPGGGPLAAQLQFARSLTRRAERRMVALNSFDEINHQLLRYLNRLSDFLFMVARDANHKSGIVEDAWMKGRR